MVMMVVRVACKCTGSFYPTVGFHPACTLEAYFWHAYYQDSVPVVSTSLTIIHTAWDHATLGRIIAEAVLTSLPKQSIIHIVPSMQQGHLS